MIDCENINDAAVSVGEYLFYTSKKRSVQFFHIIWYALLLYNGNRTDKSATKTLDFNCEFDSKSQA